jgi:hypothetical protein
VLNPASVAEAGRETGGTRWFGVICGEVVADRPVRPCANAFPDIIAR